MADLTPSRKNLQVEETRFRSAVSESIVQKAGSSINFINERQHSEKQFFINGNYSAISLPFIAIDGYTFFQFDAEIIDVWMFIQFAGSGGTTELDIKRATTPGGSFSSIFSTTPKISSLAGDGIWIHVGSSFPNTTAPVLALSQVNAGDALRCDLIQAQSGATVNGCGIVVHYRPR
jgi:hypothetical protein